MQEGGLEYLFSNQCLLLSNGVMVGASHGKILFIIYMERCEQCNKKPPGKILLGRLDGPWIFRNWDSFWLHAMVGQSPPPPQPHPQIQVLHHHPTEHWWQQQRCKGWEDLGGVTPSWPFLPGFFSKVMTGKERGAGTPIPFDAIN